jgi:hypothetical protein
MRWRRRASRSGAPLAAAILFAGGCGGVKPLGSSEVVASLADRAQRADAEPPIALLGPLSGTLVTSSAVAFRWRPPIEARVEVAESEDFGRPIATAVGKGEAVVTGPGSGTWFWRVVGGDATSAVWNLRVVARAPGPVRQGTFQGTDVDGDGAADVVFRQAVHLGRRALTDPPIGLTVAPGTPCRAARGTQAPGDRCESFAFSRSVGDLDGDGKHEWVGGDESGLLLLFRGRAAPADPWIASLAVCPSGAAGECRKGNIARIGDVNGDGYSDVAVDHFVHAGGRAGLGAAPLAELPAYDEIAGGDLDNDGFFDVVGATNEAIGVHWGGPRGPGAKGATIALLEPPEEWTRPRLGVGDMDGDGFADVVVAMAAGDRPRLGIIHGGSRDAIARAEVSGDVALPPSEGGFRWDLDPNVGGESARVVAIDRREYHHELLTIGYTRAGGFALDPIRRVRGSTLVSRCVEVVGDVDGDGVDDIAEHGQPDADEQPALCLYHGRPGPLDVLAIGDAACWYHDGARARPEVRIVTDADRREYSESPGAAP